MSLFDVVAAIRFPLPDREEFAEVNSHLDDADLDLVYSEACQNALDERRSYLARLEQLDDAAHEQDEEFDALLAELEACRAQIDEAEHRMRLLLAYGREFVRPQPYQLKDLARAADISVSGVRIAYGEDEITEAAQVTGAKPRRPALGAGR
ncbi:hypothetical protein [Actinoplanes sp. NPDC049118]|uniref:hypothetical protein n=1 Tax=Actinoplanes sp. NPDC049118 TaxID=3155769 RepID=UPI0033DAB11D